MVIKEQLVLFNRVDILKNALYLVYIVLSFLNHCFGIQVLMSMVSLLGLVILV